MVLEDVTELYVLPLLMWRQSYLTGMARGSDYSGSHTKLPKILLNGNNICMVLRLLRLPDSAANLTIADSWRRRTNRSHYLIEM